MSQTAEREVRMQWRGKQYQALKASERECDIEGALRASKTTICLWREFNAVIEHPGIHGMLARWTDEGVWGLLVPLWREMCERAGVRLTWHADEGYDELPNGSRVYIRGLKAADKILRYSKFRGLTLARAYIDQAEEIPKDVYLELAARLSQKGYPHQITISPQAVEETHWIAQEFPPDNSKPERRYIALSVHDNAHNLDDAVIPALVRLYPPEHPKHKTLVRGERGMNVTGEPVYKGAFVRPIHEREVRFNPSLPLDEGIDFGKHHPCVVWRQQTVHGQVLYLGGILGQDLYLEDFLPMVKRYRNEWFHDAVEIRSCCDPAGASDNSQGVNLNGLTVLEQHGIRPRYQPNSNSPLIRLEMVERHAMLMRKRTPQGEALLINRENWLRVSREAVVQDRFLADGFEAGYVWDEHTVSVANKQVRRPKKDGWYEHGQNCAEYLELNFGGALPPKKEPPRLEVSMPAVHPMGWAG